MNALKTCERFHGHGHSYLSAMSRRLKSTAYNAVKAYQEQPLFTLKNLAKSSTFIHLTKNIIPKPP